MSKPRSDKASSNRRQGETAGGGSTHKAAARNSGRSDNCETVQESERHQLFTVIPAISVPWMSELDENTEKYDIKKNKDFEALVQMAWPDGTPCLEMDLYLLRLSRRLRLNVDGGSVRQEAVKLSHLVRYCWGKKTNFWEMNNDLMSDMLFELGKEMRGGKSARKNNQIIQISDSCIRFFVWLQKFLLPQRRIVDFEDQPHQITLVEKTRFVPGRGTIRARVFAYNPPPNSPEDKKAMPQDAIDRLWKLVTNRLEKVTKRLSTPNLSEAARLRATAREHQAQRQILMMYILQAVPVRPSELTKMSEPENVASMRTRRLSLATKKRDPDANRVIPVPLILTMRLQVYIEKNRMNYLTFLRSIKKDPKPDGIIFLNEKGSPVTASSLTREFQRLCKAAGIEYRACMSMFRHRAITTLVAINLKEYLSGATDERVRALIASDYSAILARVATVSGHKDPQSLRPYIDLAWDELGTFDSMEAAQTVVKMMEMLLPELDNRLAVAATSRRSAALQQAIEIRDWLRAWEQEVREALEVYRHRTAHPDTLRELLP